MGGGSKSIFEKSPFKLFSAKSFSNVSRSLSDVKNDSANLTFNAFFHRNFSSMYNMVPGGPKLVV